MKKYYEAYEERYRTIHEKGFSWASFVPTPIVAETIAKYRIAPSSRILEIGCGEGRDAVPLLEKGFQVLATDASPEAIAYCRAHFPLHADRFRVLDVLTDRYAAEYDFIYAVAVIHMLVPDADRAAFYRFVRDHLAPGGIALICSMGDGEKEMQTDIADAFSLRERRHPGGTVTVAATSLRMVSFDTFERELKENGFCILEKGISAALPEFDRLMFAVIRKERKKTES